VPSILDFYNPVTGSNHTFGMNLNKPKTYGDIVDWTQDQKAGDMFYKGEGSGQGWYPIWKDSQKGAELKAEQNESKIEDQQALLSDPNSKYYTDYYKQLKGTLSAQSSLNSLLGLNRAMGLSMSGSATIANEQRKSLEGKITDYAGKSTENLFQNNIGASNSLLGMMMQNSQFQQGLQFNKSQYEDSKKFDWSSLFGVAGKVGGYFLGGSNFSNTKVGGGGGETDWLAKGSSWMDNQYGG